MTLACTRAGSGGVPIVFVHGFACARGDWSSQMRHFSPLRQVVACDLPGHGASSGGPADASIERCGAAVAALLEELAAPAVLVGHSLGCRVVLEAHRRAPARVAAISLIDGSRMGTGDPAQAADAMRAAIEFTGYPAFAEAFFAQMFVRPHPAAAAIIERAMRLPSEIGAGLLPAMVRWDARYMDEALAAICVPLLVIQATTLDAERKRVSLKAGETTPWLELVRQHVPHARIEVIPGIGHFAQIEAAEQVNALIAAL
jgi:pimeloyl-ACP methyl ester carboxylesterase